MLSSLVSQLLCKRSFLLNGGLVHATFRKRNRRLPAIERVLSILRLPQLAGYREVARKFLILRRRDAFKYAGLDRTVSGEFGEARLFNFGKLVVVYWYCEFLSFEFDVAAEDRD